MDKATLRQAEKILKIFSDDDTSAEHLQRIVASGFLADLPDSVQFPDRDELRHLFGLPPLEKPKPIAEPWSIWMTLTVTPSSRDHLLIRLIQTGFDINSKTRNLILRGGPFRSSIGDKQYKVPLIQLKVGDLGFREYPTTQELFIRARRRGLDLCPGETGLHLALALGNELEGLLWVASRVYDSNHIPHSFCLERGLGSGLILTASQSTDRITWPLARKVVFCPCNYLLN